MLSLRGGGTTTKQSLRILLNQKEERKKGKVKKNTDLAYALSRSFSSGLTKIAVNEKLEEALSATSSHVAALLAMTIYAVIAFLHAVIVRRRHDNEAISPHTIKPKRRKKKG